MNINRRLYCHSEIHTRRRFDQIHSMLPVVSVLFFLYFIRKHLIDKKSLKISKG